METQQHYSCVNSIPPDVLIYPGDAADTFVQIFQLITITVIGYILAVQVVFSCAARRYGRTEPVQVAIPVIVRFLYPLQKIPDVGSSRIDLLALSTKSAKMSRVRYPFARAAYAPVGRCYFFELTKSHFVNIGFNKPHLVPL